MASGRAGAGLAVPLSRSRARQFCQAVSAEAGGRVGRWVDIAAVGERLGLGLDRAIVLAEDCELAGFVTHDRSYFAQPKRGRELPHSVTLSAEGWNLIRKPTPRARGPG